MPAAATRRHRIVQRRYPTPGDLVLLVLLVAAVPLARRTTAAGEAGGHLLVLQQGDGSTQVVDARRDADIELVGPLGRTRVRVEGGAAWVDASPCPGQLCRRMGRIAGPGRVVACLPNRILMRFEGGSPQVDGVTR